MSPKFPNQVAYLFFLIAQASLFFPKIAEQFVPGPTDVTPVPRLRLRMHVRERGGATKMASNTEAVPGAPGFCLVALGKVRRICLARIMRAQD